MSDLAAVQTKPGEARRSLKPCQALLTGRIAEVKVTEKSIFTMINTPAPDQYSHPGNHEVISDRRIGKPGDEITVLVQLGGYRRSYRNKNGETQYTVDNVLRVIPD